MTEHTPGPWRITCADEWTAMDGGHVQFGRFDIKAEEAGGVYYMVGSVSNINNAPTNRANARLIACAPELLGILQELSDALPSAEHIQAQGKEEGPLLVRMRAVIAKATGAGND